MVFLLLALLLLVLMGFFLARAAGVWRTTRRVRRSGVAVQGEVDRPTTYREVDPALFHAVVTQQIPPGPGPSGSGRAGIDVHPMAAEK